MMSCSRQRSEQQEGEVVTVRARYCCAMVGERFGGSHLQRGTTVLTVSEWHSLLSSGGAYE